MLTRNKKLIASFFLIFTMLAAIPMTLPGNFVTEIDENQAIQKLGRSTYVVIPLTINVVEGTTPIPIKAEIEANIKRMNEIYNCEVAIFVWDGTINTIPDPEGNGDGEIDNDRESRDKARDAAEEKAGGKGASITIAGGLGDNNTNGWTTVGNPHGALVRTGTDGETWAHEMQHALGQSHGQERQADEDMDGDSDVDANDKGWDANGDGKVTPADREYNLWGRKSDRTGNKINHDVIYGNATGITGVRAKTRAGIVSGPPQGGASKDNRSDTKLQSSNISFIVALADIIRGRIIMNFSNWLKFWLQLAAPPKTMDNISYGFCIAFNDGLGCPDPDPYPWKDANTVCEISLLGGFWSVHFDWWNGFGWEPIPGEMQFYGSDNLTDTINYDNYTGSGMTESFFDVSLTAYSEDPILLSDPHVVDLGFRSFDFWTYTWTWDPPNEVYDKSDKKNVTPLNSPTETIKANKQQVKAGENITVNGTNFTPNGTVTIYVDGQNVTTAKVNASGAFSVDVTIPAGLNKNNTIISVVDSSGKRDAVYTNAYTIIAEVPAIPGFEILFIAIELLALVLIFHQKKTHPLKSPFNFFL
ncbi:MAG: hypothetical protein HWN65_20025 [Candidatus Helarchaeota archaeon]|nr:hypothetical protein [Candidatus Helarchaeota archaeon]